MKTLKLLVLFSFLPLASSFAEDRVEIPAGEILAAARTVVSQTGPGYSASGFLTCSAIASEVPPYKDTAHCVIHVLIENLDLSKAVAVEKPDYLLGALSQVKSRKGPTFQITLPFSAESIASEVPPYGVKETASVLTQW